MAVAVPAGVAAVPVSPGTVGGDAIGQSLPVILGVAAAIAAEKARNKREAINGMSTDQTPSVGPHAGDS